MMVKVTSYFTFAGDMYRRYIPQEDYFSEGLYMFDIGQNDLAGEFYSKKQRLKSLHPFQQFCWNLKLGLRFIKYIHFHPCSFPSFFFQFC